MPGAGLVRLVRDEPDKLITHQIWFFITTAMHLLVAVVTTGVFVAGTAILVLLARLIEPVRFLPVLQFAAVCVGLLASGGSLANVWKSYRVQLKSCPGNQLRRMSHASRKAREGSEVRRVRSRCRIRSGPS